MIFALRPVCDILAWPLTAGFSPVLCNSGWAAWAAEAKLKELIEATNGHVLLHAVCGWMPMPTNTNRSAVRFRTVGIAENGDAVRSSMLHFRDLETDPRVAKYPHLWQKFVEDMAPFAAHCSGNMVAHLGGPSVIQDGTTVTDAFRELRQAGIVPSIDCAGAVYVGGQNLDLARGAGLYGVEPNPLGKTQLTGYSHVLADLYRDGGPLPKVLNVRYMPGISDPHQRFGAAMTQISKGWIPAIELLPNTAAGWGESINMSKWQVQQLMATNTGVQA